MNLSNAPGRYFWLLSAQQDVLIQVPVRLQEFNTALFREAWSDEYLVGLRAPRLHHMGYWKLPS